MGKYYLALCDDEDFVHIGVDSVLFKLTKIFQMEFVILHIYSIAKAFYFLTKPLSEEDLFEAISVFLLKKESEKIVRIYKNRQLYEINIEDILYITSQSSHSLIYTANEEYRSDCSLKKWGNTLLCIPYFFQCHKSYIVNLNKVTAIRQNIILLSTGEKVLVSRRRRTACIHTMVELGITFKEES